MAGVAGMLADIARPYCIIMTTDNHIQATFLVHLLSLLSFLNAFYTFYRRRHYRLFENPINKVPSTPSAQRVRVDSSPVSSSPLWFLPSIVAGDSAESRAHPDSTRDVWEIAVWDPAPLCMQLFTLFSPGHVLVYWCFLPITKENPYPSVTVVTTLLLASILTGQMLILQKSFSQQSKDSSIIHREVMNEYDTKFVHPRSQPLMRDVGTQVITSEPLGSHSPWINDEDLTVETYPPAFVINRGFRTRPNPNYQKFVDPEGAALHQTPPRSWTSGVTAPAIQTPSVFSDNSSPIRPQTAIRQPPLRNSVGGDGGSLGVYSHARSPLKKSASTQFTGPTNQRQSTAHGTRRNISPVKESYSNPSAYERRFANYKDTPARRASGRV